MQNRLTCEDCKFWYRHPEWVETPESGECRRYAPKPTRHDSFTSAWPLTDYEDFCGEFAPAE